MLLHEDGTFEYELSSIPLIAKGNWELNNQLLTYHYTLPTDTSRSYNINISNTHLVLEENGVLFTFKAAKSNLKKSGFSLMTLLRGLLGIATLIGIALLVRATEKELIGNWFGKDTHTISICSTYFKVPLYKMALVAKCSFCHHFRIY